MRSREKEILNWGRGDVVVTLYEWSQSDVLEQMQQKISEMNAKCIVLRQRKSTGACVCSCVLFS